MVNMEGKRAIPVLGPRSFKLLTKEPYLVELGPGYLVVKGINLFNHKGYHPENAYRIPILLNSHETLKLLGCVDTVGGLIMKGFWQEHENFPTSDWNLEFALIRFLYMAYKKASHVDRDSQEIMAEIGLTREAQKSILNVTGFLHNPKVNFQTMKPEDILACAICLIKDRWRALLALDARLLLVADMDDAAPRDQIPELPSHCLMP